MSEPDHSKDVEMTDTEKQEFLEKRKQWQGTKAAFAPPEQLDADQREAEEDKNDAKEADQPIKYTVLGGPDCPVHTDDEDIEYSMSFRIPKI